MRERWNEHHAWVAGDVRFGIGAVQQTVAMFAPGERQIANHHIANHRQAAIGIRGDAAAIGDG